MKKITLLAAVALATTFVSCKKIYTCTCTATSGGSSISQSTVYTEKMSKSDADAKCTKDNASSGSSSVTCKIN